MKFAETVPYDCSIMISVQYTPRNTLRCYESLVVTIEWSQFSDLCNGPLSLASHTSMTMPV